MNFSDLSAIQLESKATGEDRSLTIEIFFDFICPWCLIGKRNLEAAMRRFAALRPDVPLNVVWRSRQLLPYTPLDGLPYQAFYLDRLGSAEAVATRRAKVQHAGRDAGIEFTFDGIEVLPNTAAAHNLVAFAASRSQRALLIDRLFIAYFIEGKNIGDWQVLEQLGLECGLERQGLTDHLAESRRLADPTGQRLLRNDHHVTGVPHFVFNAGYSLSGAYSADVMIEAMVLAVPD
jgi:predicted DsbA family dithiol-disulfide isomerase